MEQVTLLIPRTSRCVRGNTRTPNGKLTPVQWGRRWSAQRGSLTGCLVLYGSLLYICSTCDQWFSRVFLWKWICSSRGISQLLRRSTSSHGWYYQCQIPCYALKVDNRVNCKLFGSSHCLYGRKGRIVWATSPSQQTFAIHRCFLLYSDTSRSLNQIFHWIHRIRWSR